MLRAMRIMAGLRCGLTCDGLLAPCHCQRVRKRQGRDSHIGIDTYTRHRQTDTHTCIHSRERERDRETETERVCFFQSISVLLVKICVWKSHNFLFKNKNKKYYRDSCHLVSSSLCLCRHRQCRHVWQKYEPRHVFLLFFMAKRHGSAPKS